MSQNGTGRCKWHTCTCATFQVGSYSNCEYTCLDCGHSINDHLPTNNSDNLINSTNNSNVNSLTDESDIYRQQPLVNSDQTHSTPSVPSLSCSQLPFASPTIANRSSQFADIHSSNNSTVHPVLSPSINYLTRRSQNSTNHHSLPKYLASLQSNVIHSSISLLNNATNTPRGNFNNNYNDNNSDQVIGRTINSQRTCDINSNSANADCENNHTNNDFTTKMSHAPSNNNNTASESTATRCGLRLDHRSQREIDSTQVTNRLQNQFEREFTCFRQDNNSSSHATSAQTAPYGSPAIEYSASVVICMHAMLFQPKVTMIIKKMTPIS